MGVVLEIVALLLSLLFCPLLSGLAGFVLLPLSAPIRLASDAVAELAVATAQGFLAFAIGVGIYGLFGLAPGLPLLIVLVVGFGMNDLRRLNARVGMAASAMGEAAVLQEQVATADQMRLIGDALGLLVGAFYFVF